MAHDVMARLSNYSFIFSLFPVTTRRGSSRQESCMCCLSPGTPKFTAPRSSPVISPWVHEWMKSCTWGKVGGNLLVSFLLPWQSTKNTRREGFVSSYISRSQFTTEGSQDRKLETETMGNATYWIAYWFFLLYIAQDHLPRYSASHSRLGLLIPINN